MPSIIRVGGAPATGDAVATDLLSGKTATTAVSEITGSMPNNGAVNITPSASNQAIAAGYHNGSGVVAGDADLVAGNIQSGVNIFGVVGSFDRLTGLGVNQTAGGTSCQLTLPASKKVATVYGSQDAYSAVDYNAYIQVYVAGAWQTCSSGNGSYIATGGASHIKSFVWVNNGIYKDSIISDVRIVNGWGQTTIAATYY